MYNKTVFILGFMAFLGACSETKGDASNASASKSDSLALNSNAIDSSLLVVEELSPELTTILENFKKEIGLPLKVDSLKLESYSKENFKDAVPIKSNLVRFLSQRLSKDEISGENDYIINSFLLIDSLKTHKKYKAYVNTIDIGMVKEAEAHLVHQVRVSENVFIVLWMVSISSYEACPYFSASVLYGSLFVDNHYANCAVLGEVSGGGDAPYWGTNLTTCILSDDKILIKSLALSGGEEDEEGNEIIEANKTKVTLRYSADGFSRE